MFHKHICLFLIIAILVGSQYIITVIDPIYTQETNNKKRHNCSYTDSLACDKGIAYDDKGIPYYDYAYVGDTYIGLQRNPVTITQQALRFYERYESNPNDVLSKDLFINNIDWLVGNAAEKQINETFPYAELEYDFPLDAYNLEPPLPSAMAQGKALDALVKAHELTANKTYLITAKKILNSFFVGVNDGGITHKTNDSGWRYEESASTHLNGRNEPKVLTNMIFAVFGIFEYYNYTNDSNANFLFDQGILALKKHFAKYENKGVPLYNANDEQTNIANDSIHLMQLAQLCKITHDPIFKEYRDRWGEAFVLTQFTGEEIGSEYLNTCGETMFEIDSRGDNRSNVLDLANASTFIWKPAYNVKVSQDIDDLDIIVETDNPDKLYNRAYLQTQLNFTNNQPLVLLLDYLAESFQGNATFAIEIRDVQLDRILWTYILDQNLNMLTSKKLLLPNNVINLPIEIRLYVITDNVGSHILAINKIKLISNVNVNM